MTLLPPFGAARRAFAANPLGSSPANTLEAASRSAYTRGVKLLLQRRIVQSAIKSAADTGLRVWEAEWAGSLSNETSTMDDPNRVLATTVLRLYKRLMEL
jgi:hypothetical protein